MAVVALLAGTTIVSACSGGPGAATAPTVPTRTATASRPPSSQALTPNTTAAAKLEPSPLTRSTPVRLTIPDIGVDTKLMDLGLLTDGSLQVPPSGFPAGWYTGGPTPGELGPAVIAGHIDHNGPGVFFNLHQLRPGELVTVTRADGTMPTFRISRVAQYPKDQFATTAVYGNLNHPGLRLITCGGSFNRRTGHYRDNIVVFADLIATPG
jgi:sortase (surface protein transpeptidase)